MKAIISDLKEKWSDLIELATLKSDKLGQAKDAKALFEMIKDANSRLDEIEKQLASKDQGAPPIFYSLDFLRLKLYYIFCIAAYYRNISAPKIMLLMFLCRTGSKLCVI